MFIVLIGMFHLDVPCVFLGLDGPTPQCFSRILIPKNGQTKPEFLSFKWTCCCHNIQLQRVSSQGFGFIHVYTSIWWWVKAVCTVIEIDYNLYLGLFRRMITNLPVILVYFDRCAHGFAPDAEALGGRLVVWPWLAVPVGRWRWRFYDILGSLVMAL